MVLRSTGGAADHQPSCLGVYRLIDSLNDRPVYKQEGGENYLYYNEAKSSWMVGTNVGDSYAWIKHSDRSSESGSSSSSSPSSSSSSASDSDSSGGSAGAGGAVTKKRLAKKKGKGGKAGARSSPELLKPGCWKYKPNGFELSQMSDDDNIWMQDDVTLKVEALKGERKKPCKPRGGANTFLIRIFFMCDARNVWRGYQSCQSRVSRRFIGCVSQSVV